VRLLLGEVVGLQPGDATGVLAQVCVADSELGIGEALPQGVEHLGLVMAGQVGLLLQQDAG
jgi:hypothetical protein